MGRDLGMGIDKARLGLAKREERQAKVCRLENKQQNPDPLWSKDSREEEVRGEGGVSLPSPPPSQFTHAYTLGAFIPLASGGGGGGGAGGGREEGAEMQPIHVPAM